MAMSAGRRIESFEGRWMFLSNYYPARVSYDGVVYPTVEHAYQAAKTLDPPTRERIREAPDPDAAKRLGRARQHRPDWETVKVPVMRELVAAKFADPDLRARLLATGDAELVEGNDWGDVFWGRCDGAGANHMGRILMSLRARSPRATHEDGDRW